MPVPTKVPKWNLLVSQPPGLGHVSICDSELVTRGVQPIVCAWGTGPETRGTCLRQQGKIEYICTYIYIYPATPLTSRSRRVLCCCDPERCAPIT